jgi:hypothetical protein
MKLRFLIVPAVLIAVAVTLAKAVATRTGVGPFEYATVVLLEALIIQTAFRLSRRAFADRSNR